MSDLTTGLIIVLIVGVLMGLLFVLLSVQKRKREAALRNLASLNGWTYENIQDSSTSGFRLHKGDWTIEAANQTSKSSSTSTVTSMTRWYSETARMQDGIVMMGPHQPVISFGGLENVMVQVALQLMIGDLAADAVDIKRVELGSLELMARYMVWTNREEIAKQLVDSQLENALLAWPIKMPTVIRFSSAGLEIKIQGMHFYKEAEINTLVKLGNTLLDSACHVLKGK